MATCDSMPSRKESSISIFAIRISVDACTIESAEIISAAFPRAARSQHLGDRIQVFGLYRARRNARCTSYISYLFFLADRLVWLFHGGKFPGTGLPTRNSTSRHRSVERRPSASQPALSLPA